MSEHGRKKKDKKGEWKSERWLTETMWLAYEARVAVRGELASPKSFSRLIHDNKDDRDKRETHPRTVARCGTKTKKATISSHNYRLMTSFLLRMEPLMCC